MDMGKLKTFFQKANYSNLIGLRPVCRLCQGCNNIESTFKAKTDLANMSVSEELDL